MEDHRHSFPIEQVTVNNGPQIITTNRDQTLPPTQQTNTIGLMGNCLPDSTRLAFAMWIMILFELESKFDQV